MDLTIQALAYFGRLKHLISGIAGFSVICTSCAKTPRKRAGRGQRQFPQQEDRSPEKNCNADGDYDVPEVTQLAKKDQNDK